MKANFFDAVRTVVFMAAVTGVAAVVDRMMY